MNPTQSKSSLLISTIPNSTHLPPKEPLTALQKAAIHTAEYFKKLSKVENFCNQIQTDVKATKKQASQKIRKDLKGFAVNSQTCDKNDNEWMNELQKYKEIKESKYKAFDSLKGISSNSALAKQPIQRMQLKKNFFAPEARLISFSDVSSHVGKQILSNNRRNFGEIFLRGSESEAALRNKKISSEDAPVVNTCKAGVRKNLLSKIKDVKKLSKQLKSPKFRK